MKIFRWVPPLLPQPLEMWPCSFSHWSLTCWHSHASFPSSPPLSPSIRKRHIGWERYLHIYMNLSSSLEKYAKQLEVPNFRFSMKKEEACIMKIRFMTNNCLFDGEHFILPRYSKTIHCLDTFLPVIEPRANWTNDWRELYWDLFPYLQY